MKNNKFFMFLILSLGFVLLATGCQPQKPNVKNNRVENRVGTDTRDNIDRTDTDLNNNPNDNNNIGEDVRRNATDNMRTNDTRDMTDNVDRNLSDRAENIARKVANLNDVNSATVVISGDTAIVGIDMKNNLEGNITDDLKGKVRKIVKDTDDKIGNVSVTADPDLYQRLSNMARDIRNGKPISGFSKEIQEILRRITPNM